MTKIFIVEDEHRIARFLQMELEHEGFSTASESNGRRAYERILQEDYDLILLDIMLPDMDGLTICKKVREVSNVPIIMLTAKDEISDKVTGLDIGADDYITKPFAIQELLARIRAALRKQNNMQSDQEPTIFKFKNITVFLDRHEVKIDGKMVELTKKEYDLLIYLLKNHDHVLSREQMLQSIWGYEYMGDTNVVDVYIRYLRAKIDDQFNQKYIHTVRGIGYVIKS